MPFQKIEAERLSQTVVAQIETLILRGILRPGERLPSERDLSERLGVSRPSLRDAIADLQTRGLLVARPGAGVYVGDVLGSAFSPALVGLFSSHSEAAFDYIAFRRDMEGLAAERAAQFGTDSDRALISAILAKMEAAHLKRDPSDEAELDASFHMAIIEASHNVVMLHMMRSMYELLRQGVFYNRQAMFLERDTRDNLLSQHRTINAAIQARDGVAARAAVAAHMEFVEQAMHHRIKADRNEEIARRRLEQERSR